MSLHTVMCHWYTTQYNKVQIIEIHVIIIFKSFVIVFRIYSSENNIYATLYNKSLLNDISWHRESAESARRMNLDHPSSVARRMMIWKSVFSRSQGGTTCTASPNIYGSRLIDTCVVGLVWSCAVVRAWLVVRGRSRAVVRARSCVVGNAWSFVVVRLLDRPLVLWQLPMAMPGNGQCPIGNGLNGDWRRIEQCSAPKWGRYREHAC